MCPDEYDSYASEIGTLQQLLEGVTDDRVIERLALEARLRRLRERIKGVPVSGGREGMIDIVVDTPLGQWVGQVTLETTVEATIDQVAETMGVDMRDDLALVSNGFELDLMERLGSERTYYVLLATGTSV